MIMAVSYLPRYLVDEWRMQRRRLDICIFANVANWDKAHIKLLLVYEDWR